MNTLVVIMEVGLVEYERVVQLLVVAQDDYGITPTTFIAFATTATSAASATHIHYHYQPSKPPSAPDDAPRNGLFERNELLPLFDHLKLHAVVGSAEKVEFTT